MSGAHDSGTRITLLGRLRRDPGDQEAWGEFVEQYGPKVFAWCRRWGLQEADAQDVTQDVLLKLARKMKDFTYDPSRSFRAWRTRKLALSKSLPLYRDLIGTNPERGCVVVPISIGRESTSNTRLLLRDHNLSIRYHCTGSIGHRT